jgi:hypothetical protein
MAQAKANLLFMVLKDNFCLVSNAVLGERQKFVLEQKGIQSRSNGSGTD